MRKWCNVDTLVLDSGYQPIDQVHWKQAIRLIVLEKVEVLETYADKIVRSVSRVFQIPSVIRLLEKVGRRRGVRFSRENVFMRDKGRCQYCGKHCAKDEFTYDHVKPRKLGGTTRWENIVVCCFACNQRKGGRTLQEAGMRLLAEPVRPKSLPETLHLRKPVPASWASYLRDMIYWYGALETS
jgi:5-methylcytosine-specific restriction endonuclease McrA